MFSLLSAGTRHVIHRCCAAAEHGGGGSIYLFCQPPQQTLPDCLLQTRWATGKTSKTYFNFSIQWNAMKLKCGIMLNMCEQSSSMQLESNIDFYCQTLKGHHSVWAI